MGRLSASLPLFALLAAATMALSACGGESDADLLPGTTASQIDANLSQVEQLVAEGECVGAENSAAEIGSQVEELSGVDQKLKQALSEGAARLTENVASECEEEPVEEETEPTVEETEEEPEEKPKDEKPDEAEKEAEKEEKEAEKEAEKEQKEVEKEEQEAEKEAEENEVPPVEPGKGEGPSSGGVGPGAPVEGESD
jgi:outer membrane biosynthesis protein TonB